MALKPRRLWIYYLFLGAAESTMNLDDSFQRVAFERSGCYRSRATVGSR